MKVRKASLKTEEKATLALRGLYEQFGYKKYKMGRFEEYSLYAENKDFLAGDKVITFTDLDGRLMALKPDVTLSIIKNTNATRGSREKLYYIENIYRESKESHNFKEITQMGLEYIGDIDLYGITEVVSLAVKTLKTISPKYILEISHMSFVVELLKSMEISEQVRNKMLQLIRNKNINGIAELAKQLNLSERQRCVLCKIPTLYGEPQKTLKYARKLAVTDGMIQAVDELTELFNALKVLNSIKNVQVDFSLVNDIDYYNGIIFKGYLEELPRSVLAGGQYDSAMNMFSKKAGALGFALYLTELGRMPEVKSAFDIDAVVLYDEKTDLSALLQAVQDLIKEGESVRVEKYVPENLRYRILYKFEKDSLVILEENHCEEEEETKQTGGEE
ncbi:ATP phosphoribosyltransferase regulatory subunit [Clostridium aminobutyricum]|uniref:ATP phosphoribosyltransferase regulatory subunit n=1 Tax=Clostridium aminobutyricum TaxID=33953 RepID=A0A939DA10_CLOAM|nr:ATP phosphoribosyltransferase regulatory subunit [Clostridium aminobutyricum]MBN7774144.1 ATP phosphoribosyltransferase regulatory subunit [Clostridium aminobutyricum]